MRKSLQAGSFIRTTGVGILVRVLFSCLFFLALSACTTNPHSIADDQRENASTLDGFFELDHRGLDRVRVWIYSIDGKRVPQSAWGVFDVQALDAQALVAPGDRKVGLSLKVNVTLHANCPCRETIIIIDAAIEPSSRYAAKAERGYGYIDLWIENLDTKELASSKLRFRPKPD